MKLPRDNKGKLESFAWPGGYPMYYLDREDSVLCPECANRSDSDPDEVPHFKPVAYGYLEGPQDDPTFCDHCSKEIK